MSDPQNGIIGDVSVTELPQMEVDETILVEEKKMAKYSKTAEFKRIQDHFQDRIAFYQTYLPDGKPVAIATAQERLDNWAVANILVKEFEQVITLFENARNVVEAVEKV
tara:strand:+ start:334 stop:660 length:327 start_codon:yes stop_codon:yes gene_type:complete